MKKSERIAKKKLADLSIKEMMYMNCLDQLKKGKSKEDIFNYQKWCFGINTEFVFNIIYYEVMEELYGTY